MFVSMSFECVPELGVLVDLFDFRVQEMFGLLSGFVSVLAWTILSFLVSTGGEGVELILCS